MLVTTGASDLGSVAERLVHAAIASAPGAEIRHVRGAAAQPMRVAGVTEVGPLPGLRRELEAADLVVCLGGQTALEAASLGRPTVAVAAAGNQQPNVAKLAEAGAVVAVDLSDDLCATLEQLVRDPERRRSLGIGGRQAVDGLGAIRVAAALRAELLDRQA